MSSHIIHVKSGHSCQIMSFMSNHVIHVKSCHSCQIMSFMSNHFKSYQLCQIMSFMSNHVINVKSCFQCQIMSFMSTYVSHLLFGPFPGKHSVKSGGEGRGGEGRGVKKVFLSLRRQLRCLAEGKKTTFLSLNKLYFWKLSFVDFFLSRLISYDILRAQTKFCQNSNILRRHNIALHLLNKFCTVSHLENTFALLSSLDVHERFGSWCQSRPKGVYFTLASSKFMENFATLNVARVAEWQNKR
jgi:hypothetical protein